MKVSASFLKEGAVDGKFLHLLLCVQLFQPEKGGEARMHVRRCQRLTGQEADGATLHDSAAKSVLFCSFDVQCAYLTTF